MKAILCTGYGSPDVLHIREVETPVPTENQILIKILAMTVTSGDCRVRSLNVPMGFGLMVRLAFGVFKPRNPVLGSELAGIVVAIGKSVTRFKVGDEVFAFAGFRMGCHAEFKCLPENGTVALKPPNLSFEEAAALSFGGTTALDFFRRAKLHKGEKVLVIGASGCVGTAAVQLGKYFDAEVTGVCSARNVELVKKLGADHVIDYTKNDFNQNNETYDVIVDTVGSIAMSRKKKLLNEHGRLLLVIASLPDMLRIPWWSLWGSKKIIAGPVAERADDLHFLAKLAEAGVYRPVIDRHYSFEQIVEAHDYVDTGRKRGNVVVTLERQQNTNGIAAARTIDSRRPVRS